MKLPLIFFLTLLVVIIFTKWYASRPIVEKKGTSDSTPPAREKKKLSFSSMLGSLVWLVFVLFVFVWMGNWVYTTFINPSSNHQRPTPQVSSIMSLPLCGGKTLDFSSAKVPGEVEIEFHPECRTRVRIPEWTRTEWKVSDLVKVKPLQGQEYVDGPGIDNDLGENVSNIFNFVGVTNPGKIKIFFLKKVR